jgi:hypothetical protein
MRDSSLKSTLNAHSWLNAAAAFLSVFSLCTLVNAQSPAIETSQVASVPSAAVVPQQVHFGGALPNRAGDTVEAVFRIYSGAEGGEPLWTETQKISVALDGSYTVLLGAASAQGLPQTVFGSGQARWLGVTVERGEEQERTPLASAPYAMKAGDAQTLGGLPAGSFVTQAQLVATAQALAARASAEMTPLVAPTGTGTTNYVPLWTSSSNLGNSMLYQSSSKIGLGTTSPLAPLHVVGPNSSGTSVVIQGGGGLGALKVGADVNANTLTPSVRKLARITMPDWAADSLNVMLLSGDITGANNSDLYFGGTPGGTQYAATGLHFVTAATGTTTGGSEQMTLTGAGSLGIGTQTPAAKLEVNGTAKFDGNITFASTQTFPVKGTGGGTITGVTAGAGLTGGGTSGTVTLNVNTGSIPTLSGNNSFTGSDTFVESLYEDLDINIDNANDNQGGVSPGVRFGNASGEGIASQRVAGGDNQYGLDFFTGYARAMSIASNGSVGIGAVGEPGIGLSVIAGTNNNAGYFQSAQNASTLYIENDSSNNEPTVFAIGDAGTYCAIDNTGDLDCEGTVSGSSKDFKIDHPLDPANKYLQHTSVESSEMMNIYSGNVTTDELGVATITLPDWFEAENGDFRYQLTTIGRDAHAWVSQEVLNGQFKISTNATNVKVSWQITAVRQDSYAKAHPLVVEQDKPAAERGLYRHPELFGQSKEKGIGWARKSEQINAAKAGRSAVKRHAENSNQVSPSTSIPARAQDAELHPMVQPIGK